jgi:hypothetical protein
MKRLQGTPKLSDNLISVERISGEALSSGNLVTKVIRGTETVYELFTNASQGILARLRISGIRKVDTAIDTKIECWGGTPGFNCGGGGYSVANIGANGNFPGDGIYAQVSGGINGSNPYATPTSYGTGGGGGSGFGGFFLVPTSNPTATVSPNSMLIAGGSGGSNTTGYGAGGGASGGTGRPSFDPRSNTNAAGGGPGFTPIRFTGGTGTPGQSGEQNNTPGGGSGGAGYYGGAAGAQGVDGGEGTRPNNGGGGGSGYVSPFVINGTTTQGISTAPAGRSSVNYIGNYDSPQIAQAIKSKTVISKQS